MNEAIKLGIKTCGVLAAVYRGGMRTTLTHTYDVGALTSYCFISSDHLADDCTDEKPTCPKCQRKDPRFINLNQWR